MTVPSVMATTIRAAAGRPADLAAARALRARVPSDVEIIQALTDRVAELEGLLGGDLDRARFPVSMSQSQWIVFAALLKRPMTHAGLWTLLYGARPECDQPADGKPIQVFIYHLRQKLTPHGIAIRTLRGHGDGGLYSIDEESRAKAFAMMGEAGA